MGNNGLIKSNNLNNSNKDNLRSREIADSVWIVTGKIYVGSPPRLKWFGKSICYSI